MGELHLEVYTEVWKRMVRKAFPAFLVNKGSWLEAMVDRKHCFFFICPLQPRPLAHPRPRVIVTAHWNGLWSAGLGSLINDHENGKIVLGLDKENNNSARASRFFEHFFAVFA